MKRHNNLWDKIVDKDNLKLAFKLSVIGKKNRDEIKPYLDNEDYYIDKLHEMLVNGTFHTSKYTTRIIHEPKERILYILPFYPDRIVQHAIMNILEPIFEGLFIEDSYSCRTGKGPHKGSKKCMNFVKKYKWCLKCDISKFYPTMNHVVLKEILQHKIKDVKVLNILFDIIDSIEGEINIPIGNYISQWFGNLYLNELDMFIKHDLRIKPYIRYCDDFCIFSNSKDKLVKISCLIEEFIRTRLCQKFSKCDIFKTTRGVDFLGYRHFSSGKILVRKSTAKRMKQCVASIPYLLKNGYIDIIQAKSKLASVIGCLCHANAYNLYDKLKVDEVWRFIDDAE